MEKRVIRIMGRKSVMTPGNDSFQNELISLSGGIPPDFGRSGSVIEVTKDEWIKFNPQVIYGCGNDIDEMKSDLGLAVLIVIHDLNLACEYSDNIVFVNVGTGTLHSFGIPECTVTKKAIEDVYVTRVIVKKHPESGRPFVFISRS
ncbi:hypothetical protein MTBBW1_1940011 [Desulfamplus magnetovallimortis]|uniref:Uncharacterized protein n=1 Tax=Desulfamplus magnetovallimortis TaxID=1246637 RepID=A0A1W1HB16_9BACT|nr:hypothetical protein [Desulfamplus magnetovallimortis]SLM29684.1 hypothetical protein MTBBW1_1940011 [Desulfamplus magnetovallimortis]